MNVQEVTTLNEFNNIIKNNNILYVILFYMHGCSPCERYKPVFSAIAQKYQNNKNVKFLMVPNNADPEIKKKFVTMQYTMNANPTVKFVKNNEIKMDFIEGYEDGKLLTNLVNRFIG